jgi:hypothetical protein
MYKNLIFSILVAFLIISGFVSSESKEKLKKDRVEVVYYHGDVRCMTCNKIERLIKKAVKENFKDQIKNGNVVFKSINYDKKGNEKYADKYNLFNQTLIISVNKNNKEVAWKNSEKIWELVSSENKFINYVKLEISKSLREI